MSIELNDNEVAVLIDSLTLTKERIRAEGRDTPTIDSAQAKIYSLMSPSTVGLRIEGIDLADRPDLFGAQ